MVLANGKETNKYQITVGFGNVFCNDDGASWKRSKYECSNPTILYGRREPESIEYSVTEKSVGDKKIQIYREYSVFAPRKENKNKEFREKISTIDARGYFINIKDTVGTLIYECDYFLLDDATKAATCIVTKYRDN